MMDKFIHWQKLYLLLSATCDEYIDMDDLKFGWNHLVSDSNCNTVILWYPQNLQGMTTNVGLTFSVADTILRITIGIEQDN